MDYFERLVGTLLERRGYWVHQSYKIELSKADKRDLGKPSLPRPEIDLLAYKGGTNELLVIEVKSYLDSFGVDWKKVCVTHEDMQGRYKLFTNTRYRDLVMKRLVEQLSRSGSISAHTTPKLCLAAGKFKGGSEEPLKRHFEQKGWGLITPEEIRDGVAQLATAGYENDPVILAAKMLLKGQSQPANNCACVA